MSVSVVNPGRDERLIEVLPDGSPLPSRARRGVFYGTDLLILDHPDGRSLPIDQEKARLILAHLEEIREFVKKGGHG